MRMKQFLGILLSLVMVVMMLPVSRAEAQESTPILINSAEEMGKIGQDNDYPLSGNYRLTADITMNAMIRGDFTGTFDGHGHTITLNINDTDYNTGLFQNVKGTIQYLITDGTVSGTWGNTGAIAASIDGGVVRKCWNKAAIHCNQDIASGIVGFMGNNSTIEDCLNTGTITTNDDTNQGHAGGGITCVNMTCSGNVTRCFSTSCPEKGYYLVGGKSTNNIIITDCYYAGDLARTGSLTDGGGKLEGDAIKTIESYSNWDFSNTWIMTDEGPRIRMPKDEPTLSDFTYAAPVGCTYDGTAKEATVRVKEGVTGMGQVTVKYYSDAACNTEVQDTSNAGTYYVGITVTEGDSYNATTSVLHDSSWKFTIAKRNVTLTSASDSKAYDGKELTNAEVTVSGDGWAEGEGAEYKVTGTRKLPGETRNSFTYTLNEGTNADNYEITSVEGTLTITDRKAQDEEGSDKDVRYEITVVANSGNFTYDGTEHEVSGVESTEFIINDVTYTVSGLEVSAKGTEVGTYPVKISGTPVVTDADGNDLTKQFTVNTKEGTLTVVEKSVNPKGDIRYSNYSGDGAVWAEDSNAGCEFVFKRSVDDELTFGRFTGIDVDSKAVDASNYTAVSGSVVITLKPEYLETLAVGDHLLTANFDDGNSVTVKFTIKEESEENNSDTTPDNKKADAPETGDTVNIQLISLVMVLSMCMALSMCDVFALCNLRSKLDEKKRRR